MENQKTNINAEILLQLNRGTSDYWEKEENNIVLEEGEPALLLDTDSKPIGIKYGDGKNKWSKLTLIPLNADGVYNPNSENAQSGKAIAESLKNYVPKENGKGLSSNDFTNEHKEKLASALQSKDIDISYNPDSASAQSGKAVAEAIAVANIANNPVSKAISGNPITISDISPISHNLEVKISTETGLDLSTVKVSRYGKNLINQAELCKAYEEFQSGVYKINFYDLALDATKKIYIPLKDYVGKQLTFSFKGKVSASWIRAYVNINGATTNGTQISSTTDFVKTYMLVTPQTANDFIGITYGSGGGNIAYLKELQLELGEAVSDYETFKEPQIETAEADGIIKGLTSVFPNMTIIPSVDVNIDVKYYKKDPNTILKKMYVSPFMFGAVGDGITDDTKAIQKAFDSGFDIDGLGLTYNINALTIAHSLKLSNINFVVSNPNDWIISILPDAENISILNLTLNGNNSCNGIKMDYAKNIKLENCDVYNIKHAGVTDGIFINRCFNVNIANCQIYNILNNNALATRAIQSNRSNRVVVSNCIIHDVVSDQNGVISPEYGDGDGIHFIYDGVNDESFEQCVISNCDFYNCSKRYIKIQQQNVVVEKCTILYEKSEFEATQSGIAIYDSRVTLRDNYIHSNSTEQVVFGGANSAGNERRDITIINNVIKTGANASQGCLNFGGECDYKNIIITGNIFEAFPVETDEGISYTESGVYLRNSKFKNINISENTFTNVTYAVFLRWDDSETVLDDFTITGNICTVNYSLFRLNTKTICNVGTVTGNTLTILNENGQAGAWNTITAAKDAIYDFNKLRVENNISPNEYFVDGLRRYGHDSLIPTNPYEGFVFFSESIKQNITYRKYIWYLPDGTVYKDTTPTE